MLSQILTKIVGVGAVLVLLVWLVIPVLAAPAKIKGKVAGEMTRAAQNKRTEIKAQAEAKKAKTKAQREQKTAEKKAAAEKIKQEAIERKAKQEAMRVKIKKANAAYAEAIKAANEAYKIEMSATRDKMKEDVKMASKDKDARKAVKDVFKAETQAAREKMWAAKKAAQGTLKATKVKDNVQIKTIKGLDGQKSENPSVPVKSPASQISETTQAPKSSTRPFLPQTPTKESEPQITLPTDKTPDNTTDLTPQSTQATAPSNTIDTMSPTPVTAPPATSPMSAETLEIISVSVVPDITSTKMEWQTNKPTESKVFISGGGFSFKIFTSMSGLSTRHSATISGLSGETTYSYEIEAITGGISATKKQSSFKTLPPPPPPQPTVSFTFVRIVGMPRYVLKWESQNSQYCKISPTITDETLPKYTLEVSPKITTTYTITCTGLGGSVTKSLTLEKLATAITPENSHTEIQILKSISNRTISRDPVFRVITSLPHDSIAYIKRIKFTLISEFPDNYSINTVQIKGQDIIDSFTYYPTPPPSPVIGPAILKEHIFQYDNNFGPEEVISVSSAQVPGGNNGRFRLRIDELIIYDNGFGDQVNITQSPVYSDWVSVTNQ